MSGSYNTIQGFRIRNGYGGGIEVGGNYNKIIDNEISYNGTKGPMSSPYGQDGISGAGSYLTIDRNYIHHIGRPGSNADHGLYLHGDYITITNNIITFNAKAGIQVIGEETVSKMKIYNNTIAFNSHGAGIIINKTMSGIDIKNNILYKNGIGFEAYYANGTGVVLKNNIFYGNTDKRIISIPSKCIAVSESGTILSKPLFLNETSNYRMTSGPAIDKGTSVPVAVDFDKKSRPRGLAIDIGAFEK